MDESLKVGGILLPQVECTKKVIAERRLNILREAAAQSNKATSLVEACTSCTNVFEKLSVDIPFSLVYLLDDSKKKLVLQSSSGFETTQDVPQQLDISGSCSQTTLEHIFQKSLQKFQVQTIDNPLQFFGPIPKGHWNETPTLAIAIRINSQDQKEGAGVFVMGINTRRSFDSDYQSFVELLTSQLSKAISTAQSYEYEKKKADELAKLDAAKTAFFANISHEFRTPLTLILNGIEQLEKDKELLPLEQQDALSMVARNSKRLLKLVNTLLDFSRIEAGRVDMCFSPTNIVEYTKSLANLFEQIIKKEGLEFDFYCENDEEIVYLDTNMWEKIILNLLSNAFKFTLQGSIQVQIQKDTQQNNILVKVVDSGVGIASSEIPNLFKRFYRIAGSKGRSFEGSGIGLALVQELVKHHGGSIFVESQVNKGTTFTVSIPLGTSHLPSDKIKETTTTTRESSSSLQRHADFFLAEATQWTTTEGNEMITTTTPPLTARTEENKFKGSHIVVVDDNMDVRKYIKKILSPIFKVHLCCDGKEAYDYAVQCKPDLIVSDVMMPNIDGFTLIQLLRANEKTNLIPVILLSARAGEEAKLDGLKYGANDYLIKTSFSAKELIARITVHLEFSQLRLHIKQQVFEKELMVEKLKETQQKQEEFIDTLCHEIRNPLAGILGSSEVIEDIATNCATLLQQNNLYRLQQYLSQHMTLFAGCIQNIQECVMHQTMIANDVLSLSKLDAGKIDIHSNAEQIAPLVQSSIGLFTSQIAEKQLQIVSNVVNDLVLSIDGRKYKQIVINFLSNAIKFSETGKTIWVNVEYSSSSSMLKTSVRDEGKGMSPEDQKQLFQRFSQVNQTMGHKYEGFGLGLVICSKLVKFTIFITG